MIIVKYKSIKPEGIENKYTDFEQFRHSQDYKLLCMSPDPSKQWCVLERGNRTKQESL